MEPSSQDILETIYEATYNAWMDALGRNGKYPITAEAIHKVIGAAVENGWRVSCEDLPLD